MSERLGGRADGVDKRRRRVRMRPGWLTVLALIGFSLACGGLSGEEPSPVSVEPQRDEAGSAASQASFERYVISPYEYCDAVVRAGMWGDTEVLEAKEAVGRLLLEQGDELVESKLEQALSGFDDSQLRCPCSHFGLSYEGAVLLGGYWGTDSWDAKLRVEETFLRDGHSDTHIMEALRQARSG